MKKLFNKQFLEDTNVMITLSAIAATLGAYLSLPTIGIVSTVPLVAIISAGMTFVIRKCFLLPTMVFIMTYLFAFFNEAPLGFDEVIGGYALRVTLKAAILSILGCLAVLIVKDKNKIFKNKWLPISTVLIVFVFTIAVSVFENGTPWGYTEAKEHINAVIEQRFDIEGIRVSKIYSIAGKNAYECDFNISGTDKTSHIRYEKGKLTENATEMYTLNIADSSVIKMTEMLRSTFKSDSFEVTCKYVGAYKDKLSLSDRNTISKHLKYVINIYGEETAKTFYTEAKNYFSAIQYSGIPCTSIEINGGVRRKMFYTLEGNPYIPQNYIYKCYNNALMPNSIQQ